MVVKAVASITLISYFERNNYEFFDLFDNGHIILDLIQNPALHCFFWIPACAGMTKLPTIQRTQLSQFALITE